MSCDVSVYKQLIMELKIKNPDQFSNFFRMTSNYLSDVNSRNWTFF